MGYFPFFIDIAGKKCLVVGGGTVALRKIEKLLPFEPDITVTAPGICSEIRSIECLKLVERAFEPADIDGAFFVIGATDNEEVNAEIYRLCTEKGILVNIVDDKEKCGFIFPALVKKGEVTIGISTSGSSPVFARHIKHNIDDLLTERELNVGRILAQSREKVKQALPTERERKAAFEEILRLAQTGAESIDVDEIISGVRGR
ncbi:MAG: bifunctional precorrin-2 dehydrogenase/sirohydrochlorin ferrochelatase [Oscillospiraceae bacterium]